MKHDNPAEVKFGSKDKARRAVERKAYKRRTRPIFGVKGQDMRGLLPEEIAAFFAGVEAARGRHLREHREHRERMRKVDIP